MVITGWYNNGATRIPGLIAEREMAGVPSGTKYGVMALCADATLPANATVELWITSDGTNDVIIKHASMKVGKIGG